jgi:hypothetical protein
MDFKTTRFYDYKILKSDDAVLKSANLKILQSTPKKKPQHNIGAFYNFDKEDYLLLSLIFAFLPVSSLK